MGYKWCNVMNMWCSDMDEEDCNNAQCDGDCKNCEECEEITSGQERI